MRDVDAIGNGSLPAGSGRREGRRQRGGREGRSDGGQRGGRGFDAGEGDVSRLGAGETDVSYPRKVLVLIPQTRRLTTF